MMQQADIALGIGARSEKGRREDNQDKMTAFSTLLGTFYIVADGMGGHRGGAEASLSVVEGYRKHLQTFAEGADFADVVQHATTLTNAEILAAGRSGDPSIAGMGSTVVMAMLRSEPGTGGMEVLTAHIGDSRAYLLRGGKLTQLSHDHSAVQRMVDEGLISAEAAKTHPDLNVLTRAIGKQADILIEVGQRVPLYPGDTILLCTDGLWGHVPDEQMAYELSVDRSASETADTLVQLALDRGSDDNITLQILRLEDRNAAGRPYLPPIAPVAVPAVNLPEMQRGRGTAGGVTMAAAPMVAAPMAAAPMLSAPMGVAPGMRTEVFAPTRRKSRGWVYGLLFVAGLLLLGAGAYSLKQVRGLWTKPTATEPCGTGKKNSPPCPSAQPEKSTAAPGKNQSGEKSQAEKERQAERERQTQKDQKAARDLNKKNHVNPTNDGIVTKPADQSQHLDPLQQQQNDAAKDKPKNPAADPNQHR